MQQIREYLFDREREWEMLKLGIMQPYFVPYIGYWQLMNTVDTYVVYDDVNYIKRGWINRNRVLVGGSPQYVNIELAGASQNKLINEIELVKDSGYAKRLLRTLELNYKKAPFFNDCMELLQKILENPQKNLALFLFDQISMIAEYLGISTKLILSSSLQKDCSLHGEDKILDICRCLHADEYYNAIGGKELYSRERFLQNEIALKFLETDNIVYKQFGDTFYSNLSIVDVMMFNSKKEIALLLDRFHVV